MPTTNNTSPQHSIWMKAPTQRGRYLRPSHLSLLLSFIFVLMVWNFEPISEHVDANVGHSEAHSAGPVDHEQMSLFVGYEGCSISEPIPTRLFGDNTDISTVSTTLPTSTITSSSPMEMPLNPFLNFGSEDWPSLTHSRNVLPPVLGVENLVSEAFDTSLESDPVSGASPNRTASTPFNSSSYSPLDALMGPSSTNSFLSASGSPVISNSSLYQYSARFRDVQLLSETTSLLSSSTICRIISI